MKKTFYLSVFFLISILLVFILLKLSGYFCEPHNSDVLNIKKIDGKFKLFRNGSPFYIKGAGGDSFFAELKEAGANTIRLYDTIDLRKNLMEADKYDLAVIVDIPIPQYQKEYNFYDSDQNCSQLKNTVKQFIKKYKNYPSVLFWNLGNELRYPLVLKKNSFVNTYNDLINIIKEQDPNHLISTSIILHWKTILSIHIHSPRLDVIGINIFGAIKYLKSYMHKLSYLVCTKPYYLSEWGGSGAWEQNKTAWQAGIEQTSTKKGEKYKEAYTNYIKTNPNILGSLAFYWGQKQEWTHTWFSIFDEQGRKSQVYYALKNVWRNQKDTICPIQLKYMLINQIGANDNPIFIPNQQVNAEVYLENPVDTDLVVYWEIYKEGWYYEGNNKKHKKPDIINVCFNRINKTKFEFKTPPTEGPYRIYTYVYDKSGNFATTNTPFYILDPNDKEPSY